MMKRKLFTFMFILTMIIINCANIKAEDFWRKIEDFGNEIEWKKQYIDKYNREISVDIMLNIPTVNEVPILLAEKVNVIDKIITPDDPIKEENGFAVVHYKTEDNYVDLTIGMTSQLNNYIMIETKNKSDNNEKHDNIVIENKTYTFEEYELKNNVQLSESLNCIIDKMNSEIKKYIPNVDFDFSIYRAGIDEYTGNYKCVLRQKMEGIPVLLGAWDTILKLNVKDINFDQPIEWSGESIFRYGDFFLPSWMLESDMDGNFSFLFWPIQEIKKMVNDVPLCNVNDIINCIEEKILDGYIRNVYSLRFGYCCYPTQNEEIILYPVWEVECDYLFNPKQEMSIYSENLGIPVTSGRYYSTMIINAQTGKFMDPIELKDNLLDCPQIITWDEL